MTVSEKPRPKYFPGLNILRFFAAFSVLIYHVEEYKRDKAQISGHFYNSFIKFIGPTAVTFFFVLSGFLITYLLFEEKTKYNTIKVKQFYLRRILRIWPLYFLIITLGLFVLPHLAMFGNDNDCNNTSPALLAMYYTFLPNLALVLSGSGCMLIAHTWSIGVEEQFYLFWPWLIKFFKKPLRVLIGVIVIMFFLKAGANLIYLKHTTSLFWNDVVQMFQNVRFECMAIGGIGAYLVFYHREKMNGIWFSAIPRYIMFAMTAILLWNGVDIPVVHNIVYSILFCYIILYVSLFNELKWLSFLNYFGTISYGIYMYHPMVIVAVMLFLQHHLVPFENDFTLNIWAFSLSTVITLVVSALSYQFWELPFLKLKKKFEKV